MSFSPSASAQPRIPVPRDLPPPHVSLPIPSPTAAQTPLPPSSSSQPSNAPSTQRLSLQRMIQAALANASASASTPPAATQGGQASPPAAAFDSAAIARSLNALASQYRPRDGGLPAHSLSDILHVDRVLPLLDEGDWRRLAPLLPGGEGEGGDVGLDMRSAQFAQTVGRMNGVLNGENYGSLLSSLGLEMGNGGFGVEGLVQAIERQVQREKTAREAGTGQSQQPQDEAKR